MESSGVYVKLNFDVENGALNISPQDWELVCHQNSKLSIHYNLNGTDHVYETKLIGANKNLVVYIEGKVTEADEVGKEDERDNTAVYQNPSYDSNAVEDGYSKDALKTKLDEMAVVYDIQSRLNEAIKSFNQSFELVSTLNKSILHTQSIQDYSILCNPKSQKRSDYETTFYNNVEKKIKDKSCNAEYFNRLISVNHLNRLYDGRSLISLAIIHNRVDVLEVFLNKAPDLTICYQSSMVSVCKRYKGASSNTVNAIQEAAFLGNVDAFSTLCEHSRALELELKRCEQPLVKSLGIENIPPFIPDTNNWNVLHFWVAGFRNAKDKRQHNEILKQLSPHREPLLIKHREKNRALVVCNPLELLFTGRGDKKVSAYAFMCQHAKEPSYVPLIQFMLGRAFEPKDSSKLPEECLILNLCKSGSESAENIDLLIACCGTEGVQVDMFNDQHKTALMEALANNKLKFAKILLKAGASLTVSYKNTRWSNPLIIDDGSVANAFDSSTWEWLIAQEQFVEWVMDLSAFISEGERRKIYIKSDSSKASIVKSAATYCIENRKAELLVMLSNRYSEEYFRFDIQSFSKFEIFEMKPYEQLPLLHYLIVCDRFAVTDERAFRAFLEESLKKGISLKGETPNGQNVLFLCVQEKHKQVLDLLIKLRSADVKTLMQQEVTHDVHQCSGYEQQTLTILQTVAILYETNKAEGKNTKRLNTPSLTVRFYSHFKSQFEQLSNCVGLSCVAGMPMTLTPRQWNDICNNSRSLFVTFTDKNNRVRCIYYHFSVTGQKVQLVKNGGNTSAARSAVETNIRTNEYELSELNLPKASTNENVEVEEQVNTAIANASSVFNKSFSLVKKHSDKSWVKRLSIQEYSEIRCSHDIKQKNKFYELVNIFLKNNAPTEAFTSLISVEHLNQTYRGDLLIGLIIRNNRNDVLAELLKLKPILDLSYDSPDKNVKLIRHSLQIPVRTFTALREAAFVGNAEAVSLLIKNEDLLQKELLKAAEPKFWSYESITDKCDVSSWNVMHYLILGFNYAKDKSDHNKVIKLLINYRQELLVTASEKIRGLRPLSLLYIESHKEHDVYTFLSLHMKDPNYFPLFHLILGREFKPNEKYGGDVEEIVLNQLCIGAEETEDNIQLFRELCKTPGLQINLHHGNALTVLEEAIIHNKKQFAKILLEHGARLYIPNYAWDECSNLMVSTVHSNVAQSNMSPWERLLVTEDPKSQMVKYYIYKDGGEEKNGDYVTVKESLFLSWIEILMSVRNAEDIKYLGFGDCTKDNIIKAALLYCVEHQSLKHNRVTLIAQIVNTFNVNDILFEYYDVFVTYRNLSFVSYLIISMARYKCEELLEAALKGGATVLGQTLENSDVLSLCAKCNNLKALQILIAYRPSEVKQILDDYKINLELKDGSVQLSLTVMECFNKRINEYLQHKMLVLANNYKTHQDELQKFLDKYHSSL